jgi:hypothetical protein
MTTYIYAVCDDSGNHLKTVNAASMQQAKEKIIDIYRNDWDIDEEFDNWMDFIDYMEDRDVFISISILDVEAV